MARTMGSQTPSEPGLATHARLRQSPGGVGEKKGAGVLVGGGVGVGVTVGGGLVGVAVGVGVGGCVV